MTDNDKCAREQYIIQLEAEVRKLREENCVLKERNNLTEIYKVEEALRLSEEKFSKVFHFSPMSIAILRQSDGVYVDLNEAYAKTFGYEPEYMLGKSDLDLGLWIDTKDRHLRFSEIKEKGYINNYQCQFKRKSGEIGIGLTSAEVININGEECLITSGIDITQQKVSEDKFYKSFHNSGTMKAIARLDDNIIIDVNNSFSSTLGFDREEMIGKTAFELGIWADPSDGQKMRGMLSKNGSIKDCEYKIRTKSGEINYVVSNINLINVDGEECILSSSNNCYCWPIMSSDRRRMLSKS